MNVTGEFAVAPRGAALEVSPSIEGASRSLRDARLGVVALAGLLVTGVVVSVAAAGTDTLLPETTRPVPSDLAGPLATGLHLGVPALVVVLSVMFTSYAIAVCVADRVSGRAALMCIAALHAVVLLAPPLFSTDTFSYQAYAHMGGLYGINPYLHGPNANALDSVFPYVDAKWSYIPSTYGPVFTVLSYLLAPLSVASATLVYKALAALASLVTVALVWKSAQLRAINPVRAVTLVGLNPLVVVYGVGGGHNDLLMLAAMAAGLYMMLRHQDGAGGALIAVAAGIKLTAGVLLPFAIVGRARRQAGGHRQSVAIGAALASVLIGIASFAFFGTGIVHVVATLQKTQDEGDWHSIPGFVATRFGIGNGNVGHTAGLLMGIVFLALLCWLLWRSWKGEIDWIAAAGWATLALLATATALLPWYVAWVLPLAALAGDTRLWRASVAMTGLVVGIQLLGYIPSNTSLLRL